MDRRDKCASRIPRQYEPWLLERFVKNSSRADYKRRSRVTKPLLVETEGTVGAGAEGTEETGTERTEGTGTEGTEGTGSHRETEQQRRAEKIGWVNSFKRPARYAGPQPKEAARTQAISIQGL